MPRGTIFRILSNGRRRNPKIPKTHSTGPNGQSFRALRRFIGAGKIVAEESLPGCGYLEG